MSAITNSINAYGTTVSQMFKNKDTGIQTKFNKEVAIPPNSDLNNYTTEGFYSQPLNTDAANGMNYPTPLAGVLQVNRSGESITTQLYIVYNSGTIHSRSRYGSTWYPWKQIIRSDDRATLAASADTATKLTTARTINGVAFDGTANITLPQSGLQDIRLGGYEHINCWRGPGWVDQLPYVLTQLQNGNQDDLVDNVGRRPLQKLINGTWYNVGG